ncbi:MAG: alanyl-tRNA editing protein [Bacillota bacterium]
MEVRRLYWERPCDVEFEASVTRIVQRDGRTGIVLDQTLFHPEGGGQPHDTGYLSVLDGDLSVALGTADLPVTAVSEDGGQIVHWVQLDSPDGAPALASGPLDSGPRVRGRIDWDRRFDLMQQHTGQHILSRAFEQIMDAKTVGFHLAAEYVSIDLDAPTVTAADLVKVEDLANRIVWSNVPVVVKEYGRGEMPPEVRARFQIDADTIRVIQVGEFDACPCGGTHVSSTGQVGLIKINQTDRAHGGARVVFRCGGRALADYRQRQDLLAETARIVSQPAHAVPTAVAAVAAKLQELQEQCERTSERLLEMQIEALVSPENLAGQDSVVVALDGASPDRLKYAAKKIAEASGKIAVCISAQPRFSVAATSLSQGGPDARAVVSAIADRWGGRGGGTPQMAQLGSKEPLQADLNTVVEDVKRICREMLRRGEY